MTENKPKPKILIIDDEEGVRKVLTAFCHDLGFQSLSANTGEEGLRMVEDFQPIIVLLDVTMSGMDGVMVLQRIREMNSRIGVIMVTGLNDESVARETVELGAYGYVLKPLDFDYLERMIMTYQLMLA